MLRVHSIESLGTFDGPGIRLVIFTISLEGGKMMDIEEIVSLAVNQKPFFRKKGGVTISGGEPLLQAEKLIQLFKRLHEEGINTCIDSNGSVFSNSVKELLEHTDIVLLDIKHINLAKHFEITGKSNAKTFEFAEFLRERNIRVWLRYVLVPTLTDASEHLHALGKHFESYDNIEKIEIQPYHSLGVHKYEHLGLEYKLKGVKENTN